jgi:hypothetical protein
MSLPLTYSELVKDNTTLIMEIHEMKNKLNSLPQPISTNIPDTIDSKIHQQNKILMQTKLEYNKWTQMKS